MTSLACRTEPTEDGIEDEDAPTFLRRRPAASERRGGARLPIEMDISVEGAANRSTATTGDLSHGGVFVVTTRQLPVDTHVMLSFTLPNGRELEVLGAVKWHKTTTEPGGDFKLGFGVSFFCLAPDVKATLEEFCAVREPLYFADALTDALTDEKGEADAPDSSGIFAKGVDREKGSRVI